MPTSVMTPVATSAAERVSVVVPCFNSGATLAQTVSSLRAQTWPDLEIILVDDGSTEPATIAEIARIEREGDVVVLRQPNSGLPAARNTGMRRATGAFLLPLDADDWLDAEAIAKLHATLATAVPSIGFSYAYLALEGEGSGVLRKHYNLFEQLFLNQLPYCLLMRRELWERSGGYDESMRGGYEDWEFNIRLGLLGIFGRATPEPLFHYRISSTGMLMAQSSGKHHQLWRGIQRKHAKAYRLGALVRLWRVWRRAPSNHPLWFYFGWFAAYNILPKRWFMKIFAMLRPMSQSRRATRAAS